MCPRLLALDRSCVDHLTFLREHDLFGAPVTWVIDESEHGVACETVDDPLH